MARRRLGAPLDDVIGSSAAGDVRLALTELIANVVRHGEVDPDDRMVLDVRTTPSIISVRLRQPTPIRDGRAPATTLIPMPVGGWGLMIVERITDRWGIEPGPPGEAWFEIDLPR